jgi:hypothetical protein
MGRCEAASTCDVRRLTNCDVRRLTNQTTMAPNFDSQLRQLVAAEHWHAHTGMHWVVGPTSPWHTVHSAGPAGSSPVARAVAGRGALDGSRRAVAVVVGGAGGGCPVRCAAQHMGSWGAGHKGGAGLGPWTATAPVARPAALGNRPPPAPTLRNASTACCSGAAASSGRSSHSCGDGGWGGWGLRWGWGC